MKKTLFKIASALMLSAGSLTAQTSLSYVDIATLTTNHTSSSAYISIPGVCTNAPYTATNPITLMIGDPLATAFGKCNSNFVYLQFLITSNLNWLQLSNALVPNFTISNSAYGTSPTNILTGISNGTAYFLTVLPAGAPGTPNVTNASASAATLSAGSTPQFTLIITNGGVVGFMGVPYIGAYTNAVFPTPTLTLLDTNPILFNGSNYLGVFTNVYTATINTPSTGVGTSVGSNTVENLYASYTGTNGWFIVTNFPCNFFGTNVYLSAVGQGTNVTMNTGEVIIYGLLNYQYAGLTFDLSGTTILVADGGGTNQAVNYETMVNYVGSTLGYTWLASGNGIAYAPFGLNVLTLAQGGGTASTNISLTSVSTNWLIQVATTNQAAGAALQSSLDLRNTAGWFVFSPTLYTVATNSGTITYTIPKANTSKNYQWFRLIALTTPAITAYAPITSYSPIMWPSNSWANTLGIISNSPNMTFGTASSNGMALVDWYWSNSVVYTRQRQIP